jgi:hypothetical protein
MRAYCLIFKKPAESKQSPKDRNFAQSGANPTIVFYNAGAVKIYNATSSLVRFENKNIFFDFERTL